MYNKLIKEINNDEQLISILKDELKLNEIVLRKVNENTYFLVCDDAGIASMVLSASIDNCKFRLLKDSPDNIRYYIVILEIV